MQMTDLEGTGLIPAHAGKTGLGRVWFINDGAHPRSRGENDVGRCVLLPGRGSSPLTRGKRTDVEAARLAYRLIPAHAGKTVPISSVMVMVGAHPRSRGENANTRTDALQSVGSSPLTRGKPQTV